MKKRKRIIKLLSQTGPFAEDKDVAAELREKIIRPSVEKKIPTVLDFDGVEGATQCSVSMLSQDHDIVS